ncbi:MAG: CRISPR-associated protein Cas4 [Spirochaetes bacterium]|nr:CRISPR-associated protein Cas4 [Spirochaetota bacterium]
MTDDDYYLPISAISHYLYCPRQAALIHVEQVFADNALTVAGNIGHENVDRAREETDHGLCKEYSMQVYSDRLKIIGIADVVEFPDGRPPVPVDYKHGRIASWQNHEAQVAAIAFCLEEMLGVGITHGAIYHIRSKKKRSFVIDDTLRAITTKAISELHEMIETRFVPAAIYGKICHRCSLKELCMPQLETTAPPNIFTPL